MARPVNVAALKSTVVKRVLILPFVMAFSGGCFFGTFQTAQPVRPGEMDFGLYANFPAYISPEARNAALYGDQAVVPTFGGFWGIGAMRNLTVGLTAGFLGLGPYAKWTFYKHRRYHFYSSLIPKLYIDPFSTTNLTPEVDVVIGGKANRNFSWYFSYQLLYSLTGEKDSPLLGVEPVKIPGSFRRFPYLHQYAAVGLDLVGNFKGKKGDIPYGLRMELGVSYYYYDGKYYPFLNFGIALTGGTALGCLSLAAQNPQCCFYGSLLAYDLMLRAYRTPVEDEKKKPDKEVGEEKREK